MLHVYGKNMNIALNKHNGFSLIELLVGIGLMFLVASVLVQLFVSTRQQVQTQESMARIQENARLALKTIQEDVRMAGFIGSVHEYWRVAETDRSQNRLGTLTNECFTLGAGNSFRWAAPFIALDAQLLPPRLYGVNNTNTGFTNCIPNGAYAAGTDILSIHYAALPRVANADLDRNTFYIRSNLYGAALFQCNSGGNPVTNCLQPAMETGTFQIGDDTFGSAAFPETTADTANYPIQAIAYFIRPCTNTGANTVCGDADDDTIPALVRARIEYNTANCPGNNPCVVHEPIAQGVISMQVEYGVDNAVQAGAPRVGNVSGAYRAGLPDGYVDQYLSANQIGGGSFFTNSAIEEWTNVLTVRVWLLIRSDLPEAGIPARNYSLAGINVAGAANFRHQIFTTTISIRNTAG